MLGACSGQGSGYLHAWPREEVLLMLGASSCQGLFWGIDYWGYLHTWPRRGSFTHVRRVLRSGVGISACMATGGSFTDVRRELLSRVILGYRLLGIAACMTTGLSFTHVRRELRPRVGISACMATGGSFTDVRRKLWSHIIFGYRLFRWIVCKWTMPINFYLY